MVDLKFGGHIPSDIKMVAKNSHASYITRTELTLDVFKTDLKYEMGFLCPYTDAEMLEVVTYIEEHAEELFALAKEGKL